MTDRELLELAAKAAGYTKYTWLEHAECLDIILDDETHLYFDPLYDDGDALRLAVKISLFESFDFALKLSAACSEDDPYSAARSAIVRAAAEIGKNMK